MHVRGLRRRPPSCTDALAMILIHACARIAIQDIPKDCRGRCYFNSYMREDCNPCLPLQIFRTLIYFDSCMREDCNTTAFLVMMTTRGFRFMHVRGLQRAEATGALPRLYFDSCMCEDCNVIDQDVLIHACARIATMSCNLDLIAQF